MKNTIPLKQGQEIADEIISKLHPYCEYIAVAGSIRREKEMVGDIEIVAIPHPVLDMFDHATQEHQLDCLDYEALGIGKVIKGGHKYKQIALSQGINLDLFMVIEPAKWGLIYLIRTGPAEFSKRMVTSRRKGGLLPSNYRVEKGAIWSRNHIIPTPDEEDVFNLLGMDYIEPKDRR